MLRFFFVSPLFFWTIKMVNSYYNWVTGYNLLYTYEKVTFRYSDFAIQSTGVCFIPCVSSLGNRTSRPAEHSAQDHSARISGLLGPCDQTTRTV